MDVWHRFAWSRLRKPRGSTATLSTWTNESGIGLHPVETKIVMERNLKVTLWPGWVDGTRDNPKGGPTYYRRATGICNPLQVSHARYTGGEIPNPSDADLIEFAKAARRVSDGCELVNTESGTCDFGRFGSALFRSPEFPRVQSWCISNGRDFIFATYICSKQPGDKEIAEAEYIAKALAIR